MHLLRRTDWGSFERKSPNGQYWIWFEIDKYFTFLHHSSFRNSAKSRQNVSISPCVGPKKRRKLWTSASTATAPGFVAMHTTFACTGAAGNLLVAAALACGCHFSFSRSYVLNEDKHVLSRKSILIDCGYLKLWETVVLFMYSIAFLLRI